MAALDHFLQFFGVPREKVVGRFAGAPPRAVVVNDEHAAWHQARIKHLQLHLGTCEPVGVQAKHRDTRRQVGRVNQSLFNLPLDEAQLLGWVACREHVRSDKLLRAPVPALLATLVKKLPALLILSRVQVVCDVDTVPLCHRPVVVLLRWGWHTPVCVKEPESAQRCF
eukprot:scaffold32684_cov69-Phaeocystis_antarctica.AAC.2